MDRQDERAFNADFEARELRALEEERAMEPGADEELDADEEPSNMYDAWFLRSMKAICAKVAPDPAKVEQVAEIAKELEDSHDDEK